EAWNSRVWPGCLSPGKNDFVASGQYTTDRTNYRSIGSRYARGRETRRVRQHGKCRDVMGIAESQADGMVITPLTENLGVRVDGFNVSTIDDAGKDRLRQAFLDHGLLFVTGQQYMTPQDYAAFAGILGEVIDKLGPRFCVEGSDSVIQLDDT